MPHNSGTATAHSVTEGKNLSTENEHKTKNGCQVTQAYTLYGTPRRATLIKHIISLGLAYTLTKASNCQVGPHINLSKGIVCITLSNWGNAN